MSRVRISLPPYCYCDDDDDDRNDRTNTTFSLIHSYTLVSYNSSMMCIGTFLVISHGQPETRIGFLTQSERGLDRLTWDISQATVEKVKIAGMEEDVKEKTYYVYICQKL